MGSNTKQLAELPRDTENVLSLTMQALIEGLTGIAASERKGLALSVGRVFQSIRGGALLGQLYKEWNTFREKGKIKDDYQFTDQHQNCLHELLDFLDKDIPDKKRFTVIKKIFLVAATEEVEPRDSVLPHYYLKLCRQLSSGAVLMLFTVFEQIEDPPVRPVPRSENANAWADRIAKKSGLKHRDLVTLYEQELINCNLITPRGIGDSSLIVVREYDRLTDLGYSMCRFIAAYQTEEKQ